jgi:hypothetical protein
MVKGELIDFKNYTINITGSNGNEGAELLYKINGNDSMKAIKLYNELIDWKHSYLSIVGIKDTKKVMFSIEDGEIVIISSIMKNVGDYKIPIEEIKFDNYGFEIANKGVVKNKDFGKDFNFTVDNFLNDENAQLLMFAENEKFILMIEIAPEIRIRMLER